MCFFTWDFVFRVLLESSLVICELKVSKKEMKETIKKKQTSLRNILSSKPIHTFVTQLSRYQLWLYSGNDVIPEMSCTVHIFFCFVFFF